MSVHVHHPRAAAAVARRAVRRSLLGDAELRHGILLAIEIGRIPTELSPADLYLRPVVGRAEG